MDFRVPTQASCGWPGEWSPALCHPPPTPLCLGLSGPFWRFCRNWGPGSALGEELFSTPFFFHLENGVKRASCLERFESRRRQQAPPLPASWLSLCPLDRGSTPFFHLRGKWPPPISHMVRSSGGLQGEQGWCCFSFLVPIFCLHHVLNLTCAHVTWLLSVQTTEHRHFGLDFPSSPSTPPLCITKFTAGFRVWREADGSVHSITENTAH